MIYLRIASDSEAARLQNLLREADLGPCVRCTSERELQQLLLLRTTGDPGAAGAILRDAASDDERDELSRKSKSGGLWAVAAPPPELDAASAPPGAPLRVDAGDAGQILSGVRSALAQSSDKREIARLQGELRRIVKSAVEDPDLPEAALLAMLEREWKRCLRYDRPLSIIQLRRTNGKVSADEFRTAAALLKEIADSVHRPGDAIGLLVRAGRPIVAAVLSETNAAGAAHVCERMRLKATQANQGSVQIGYATLRPVQAYRMQQGEARDHTRGAELLLEMADRALEYAGRDAAGPIVRWPIDADEQAALDA